MEETMRMLRTRIRENAERTEDALRQLGQKPDGDLQELFDAEEYSLLGGGKRIRPFLVNEVCRALGGKEGVSMPFACALEMIHTYSLIHDDLPCMDDDDFRRGKPTCHKQFGYATAVLAGDALLTKAFLTAASNPEADDKTRSAAVRLLGECAGECGMIGGQIMDLRGETETLTEDRLVRLHSMKTGALMECAALLGALSAGKELTDKEAKDARIYARKIGLAFQVIDDILDAVGDEAALGKPIGSDVSCHKTTFLTYYGVEEAREYAARLTAEAISAIADWESSACLTDLAVYLLERTY